MPLEVGFVMGVRATQEWDPIEHTFLKPFEREVNDRCDVKRDELRDDKAANDHQAERAPR